MFVTANIIASVAIANIVTAVRDHSTSAGLPASLRRTPLLGLTGRGPRTWLCRMVLELGIPPCVHCWQALGLGYWCQIAAGEWHGLVWSDPSQAPHA